LHLKHLELEAVSVQVGRRLLFHFAPQIHLVARFEVHLTPDGLLFDLAVVVR
jgi:hypothetical protein